MFQTELVGRSKHIFYAQQRFFFLKNSYRLWDNVEIYCRVGHATDDNTIIGRLRFECCIIKATNTHSEYIIPFFFHCNNCYTNASQYYAKRTVPVLHIVRFSAICLVGFTRSHHQASKTQTNLLWAAQYFFISLFNQPDAQNLFYNKFYFMPLHVSSTCAHHQEVKIVLHMK